MKTLNSQGGGDQIQAGSLDRNSGTAENANTRGTVFAVEERVPGKESIEWPTTKQVGENGALAGEIEPVLARWYEELLCLEKVDWDDDFFNLGGDSVIGTQLFAKINQAYNLQLGLSVLFEARTVRQLAVFVRQILKQDNPECASFSPLVPLQTEGSRPPLFWIPGGEGGGLLAFREALLLLGPDQPVYGFDAKVPEWDQELESIPERAAHFIQEMCKLRPRGPYYLAGFCGGGYVAFEMA